MSRKPADVRPPRPVDVVTVVMVVTAGIVLASKTLERSHDARDHPEAVTVDAVVDPIASEADVFRIEHTDLGVVPDFNADPAAHVRSLDMYQTRRPYPGAPPRVPHGLTNEEFRRSTCNICHLRGGYVARFNTYAPVTPHPEFSACLQCHVAQAILVGRPLPSTGDSIACQQCHIDPDVALETFGELDWQTVPWPERGLQALPESPQRIPHDLRTRSNCLACHSGPGAVVALRTDHPERVNCRQCHVQASEVVGVFPGPSDGSAQPTERTP